MLLHNHATPRGKHWTIPQMNKGWPTTVLCVCVCVCTGLFNESCYVRWWGSEYLDMAYNAILSLYSIFMGPIQVCTVHVCACALLIVLPGTEPSTTWVFLVFSWADLLQTLVLFVFCAVCLCRWKTIIMQTLVLKVFIFIHVQTHSNWTAALHPSVNQVSDPSLSSHLENALDGETIGICICVGVCKIGGETGTGWKQGPCSIKVNTASRLLITRKMNMNEALSLLCAWTCVDHCRGLCVNTNRLSVGRLLST